MRSNARAPDRIRDRRSRSRVSRCRSSASCFSRTSAASLATLWRSLARLALTLGDITLSPVQHCGSHDIVEDFEARRPGLQYAFPPGGELLQHLVGSGWVSTSKIGQVVGVVSDLHSRRRHQVAENSGSGLALLLS